MKKIIFCILLALAIMVTTFNFTIENIHVDVCNETAILTICGHEFIYEIEHLEQRIIIASVEPKEIGT